MENVKKESAILIGLACLIIGFLGGIVFSIYRSPTPVPVQVSSPEQQAQQDLSQQLAAAIVRFEQELAQDPNNEQTLIQLGHAYYDSGNPPKAIEAYSKALAINPNNPDVLTDMGVMYKQNGQPQKALESFDKAIKLNPKHEQARFNKGIVLMYDLKDKEGAIKVWEELVEIDPSAKAPNNMLVSDIIAQVKGSPAEQEKKQ